MAIAIVCLMAMDNLSYALAPASKFNPILSVEKNDDRSSRVSVDRGEKEFWESETRRAAEDGEVRDEAFRNRVAFRDISILIGRYLTLGISIDTLIPDIKNHVDAAELKSLTGSGYKNPVKNPDMLLAGARIGEISPVEGEKAYRMPVYGNGEPKFYYKYFISEGQAKADMVFPLGGRDGGNVYINIEKPEDVAQGETWTSLVGFSKLPAMLEAVRLGLTPPVRLIKLWNIDKSGAPQALLATARKFEKLDRDLIASLGIKTERREALTAYAEVLMADGGQTLKEEISSLLSAGNLNRLGIVAGNAGGLLAALHEAGILAGDQHAKNYVVYKNAEVKRIDLGRVKIHSTAVFNRFRAYGMSDTELIDNGIIMGGLPGEAAMDEITALCCSDETRNPAFMAPFLESYIKRIGKQYEDIAAFAYALLRRARKRAEYDYPKPPVGGGMNPGDLAAYALQDTTSVNNLVDIIFKDNMAGQISVIQDALSAKREKQAAFNKAMEEKSTRVMTAIASCTHGTSYDLELMDYLDSVSSAIAGIVMATLVDPSLAPVAEDAAALSKKTIEVAGSIRSLCNAVQEKIERGEIKTNVGVAVILYRAFAGSYMEFKECLKLKNSVKSVVPAETWNKFSGKSGHYWGTIDSIFKNRLKLIDGVTGGQKIDLNELLQELCMHLYLAEGRDRQLIKLHLPEEPVYIKGSPLSIISLICNLTVNAVRHAKKYRGKNARVDITLKHTGSNAVLTVTDNGRGISKTNFAQLKKPFFTTNGTGIGLTESKLTVMDHGGSLGVFTNTGSRVGGASLVGAETNHSVFRNKGTRFTVMLPLEEPAEKLACAVPPPLPPRGGGANPDDLAAYAAREDIPAAQLVDMVFTDGVAGQADIISNALAGTGKGREFKRLVDERMTRIITSIVSMSHGTNTPTELVVYVEYLSSYMLLLHKSLNADKNLAAKIIDTKKNINDAKKILKDVYYAAIKHVEGHTLPGPDTAAKWRLDFINAYRLIIKGNAAKEELCAALTADTREGLKTFDEWAHTKDLFQDRLMLMDGAVDNREFDLDQVMKSLLDHLTVTSCGLERQFFEIKSPGSPVLASGNELSVISLICNIADDCYKHTIDFRRKDTKIKIELQDSRDKVTITISDNGRGMTARKIAKLLSTPFFTTNGKGIGFTEGKFIVKDHGGRLTIQSVAAGENDTGANAPGNTGTTFEIELPKKPNASAENAEQTRTKDGRYTLKPGGNWKDTLDTILNDQALLQAARSGLLTIPLFRQADSRVSPDTNRRDFKALVERGFLAKVSTRAADRYRIKRKAGAYLKRSPVIDEFLSTWPGCIKGNADLDAIVGFALNRGERAERDFADIAALLISNLIDVDDVAYIALMGTNDPEYEEDGFSIGDIMYKLLTTFIAKKDIKGFLWPICEYCNGTGALAVKGIADCFAAGLTKNKITEMLAPIAESCGDEAGLSIMTIGAAMEGGVVNVADVKNIFIPIARRCATNAAIPTRTITSMLKDNAMGREEVRSIYLPLLAINPDFGFVEEQSLIAFMANKKVGEDRVVEILSPFVAGIEEGVYGINDLINDLDAFLRGDNWTAGEVAEYFSGFAKTGTSASMLFMGEADYLACQGVVARDDIPRILAPAIGMLGEEAVLARYYESGPPRTSVAFGQDGNVVSMRHGDGFFLSWEFEEFIADVRGRNPDLAEIAQKVVMPIMDAAIKNVRALKIGRAPGDVLFNDEEPDSVEKKLVSLRRRVRLHFEGNGERIKIAVAGLFGGDLGVDEKLDAIEVLGASRDETARKALEAELKLNGLNDHPAITAAIISALGEMGDIRSFDLIAHYTDDGMLPGIREEALRVLTRIAGNTEAGALARFAGESGGRLSAIRRALSPDESKLKTFEECVAAPQREAVGAIFGDEAELDSVMSSEAADENSAGAVEKQTANPAVLFTDNFKLMRANPETRISFIALGTGWIKGYDSGTKCQRDVLNPVITEIRNFCLGHGILFEQGSDEEIAAKVAAIKTEDKSSRGIVLAGAGAVSEIQEALKEMGLENDENVLLAGVNNGNMAENNRVRIKQMMAVLFEIVRLGAVDESGVRSRYPELGFRILGNTIVSFTPDAEPMPVDRLGDVYRAERFA